MWGCTAERNKCKSSSICSFDLYLFLMWVSAENPHSQKQVDVKGIRTFSAFVEVWENLLSTDNQKLVIGVSPSLCFKSIVELGLTRASSSCRLSHHAVWKRKRTDFSSTDFPLRPLQNTCQTGHAIHSNAQCWPVTQSWEAVLSSPQHPPGLGTFPPDLFQRPSHCTESRTNGRLRHAI